MLLKLQRKYFIIPGLNTEFGQSVVRILAAGFFLIYPFVFSRTIVDRNELLGAAFVGGVSLVFALTWFFAVRQSASTAKTRQTLAAVIDQGLFGLGLFLGGAIYGSLAFVPVCIAVGNGLRFGRPYGLLSWFAGAIFVIAALMLSPFWDGESLMATTIAASTIIVPLYAFKFSDPIAFENDTAQTRLRVDSLTGLLNRYGFDEELELMYSAIKKDGEQCALMILDLDGFKAVNDTCGHDAGDAALKDAAQVLRQSLVIPGQIARLGGDEFAVLLRRLDSAEKANRVAQNIHDAFSKMHAPNGLSLGASIGICVLPIPSLAGKRAIFKAADELMYDAKRSGKRQFKTSIGRSFTADGVLKESEVSTKVEESAFPT